MKKDISIEGTSSKKKRILGKPSSDFISSSYVVIKNLTMIKLMSRSTRLNNSLRKKFENNCQAIALHFVYHNFCKIHKTLRVTSTTEAGLTKDVITIEDIVKSANLINYLFIYLSVF